MAKDFFFCIIIIVLSVRLNAQIYVSPTGSDTNNGTKSQPYATVSKALSVVVAGDTIFLRGGIYSLSSTLTLSKIGTSNNFYHLYAYAGEKPVFDFSRQTSSDGIKVNGNYWHLKGIESQFSTHNGIAINGSYNTIENCSTHDNKNTGMQLGNGASYNRIINCDSYYNFDPPLGGNADGFSPKLDVGTWNYFYGCRSWQNSDDGWDGYLRPSNNVTTVLENCWTFKNGYLKDGSVSKGNGNGFKMGGGDNSNSLHLMHNFILRNCLAFDNLVKGFDQNNNDGSMTLLNCTGFGNKTANFRITRQVNAGQTVTVENSVSLNGTVDLGSFVVQQKNGWRSPFVVTAEDFVSIDTTGVSGPRKADGSLPDIGFMHLALGSDLIDGGVDVGIPFTGNAPDLGAFEFGMSMPTDVVKSDDFPTAFRLEQNYPNPFNPETTIQFIIPTAGEVEINIYDINGREIYRLYKGIKESGTHKISWNGISENGNKVASGVYLCKVSFNKFNKTQKLLLLK